MLPLLLQIEIIPERCMQDPVSLLDRHQTFCFTCSPQAACFNACCRDLNQALSPYDVWCLKRFLNLSSTDFLNRYTVQGIGPETGLPVVSLRFDPGCDLACPFVADSGCRVYPARPASCRTYPLARGVFRNRRTGKLTEQWALIREPHCRGFENGQRRTVDQWVQNQQLAVHQRMNDRMLTLISLKNQFRPGPLGPSESKRVYTALYDLDAFHAGQAAASAIRVADPPGKDEPQALLQAMDWVCKNVLGVPQGEDSQ
jgi:Fe-S-cluster containining protein